MPPSSFAVEGLVTSDSGGGVAPWKAMGLASELRISEIATTRTTTAAARPPIARPRLRFSRRFASSRSLIASARALSRRSALVGRELFVDIALPQGLLSGAGRRRLGNQLRIGRRVASEPEKSLGGSARPGLATQPRLDGLAQRARLVQGLGVVALAGEALAVDE